MTNPLNNLHEMPFLSGVVLYRVYQANQVDRGASRLALSSAECEELDGLIDVELVEEVHYPREGARRATSLFFLTPEGERAVRWLLEQ